MGNSKRERMKKLVLILSSIQAASVCEPEGARDHYPGGTFPEGFIWSVATASYQIEGGWRSDGKGNSIWDDYSHYWGPDNRNAAENRCNVDRCHTGDVACDSYSQWERDIELVWKMGVQAYRFSLSWPRLLPMGTVQGGINPDGVKYYNNLIDGLLTKGITPIVTIYHWDLPSEIQNTVAPGGWVNDTISDLFADYADFCYKTFGDRVKHWITLNEPSIFGDRGYEYGTMAPGTIGKRWEARHNTVLAHLKAYARYEKYRAVQNGQVGITLHSIWAEAESDEDVESANLVMEIELGFWAEVIYGSGKYPTVLKEKLQSLGITLGTLPSAEENRASSDFFGLNHYTTRVVRSCRDECGEFSALGFELVECPNWPGAGSSWLKKSALGNSKAARAHSRALGLEQVPHNDNRKWRFFGRKRDRRNTRIGRRLAGELL